MTCIRDICAIQGKITPVENKSRLRKAENPILQLNPDCDRTALIEQRP